MMKVNCNFTLEFDADEYREAFGLADQRMSADEIRNEIQYAASSNMAMSLSDEGVSVEVRHRI